MGNSGSVHHMQSGFKELNSYYQVQPNYDHQDDTAMLNHESKIIQHDRSLLRFQESGSQSSSKLRAMDATADGKPQIKVLPSLNENPRLRPTSNGTILQSGGTISGRRESFIPQAIERSKTFITENADDLKKQNGPSFLTHRSQTQHDLGFRNENIGQIEGSNFSYKRFISNLDLRQISDTVEADNKKSAGDTFQKLSKVKIKNKKRKAPPLPPLELHTAKDTANTKRQNFELDKKQRVFKTKIETTLQTPSILSRQQPVKPSSPVIMRSSSRFRHSANFRRHKSFDATMLPTVLCVENKTAKPSALSERKSLQLQSKTAPMPVNDSFVSKPEKTGFKQEIEAATKLRLMTRMTPKTKEPSSRQREPNFQHHKKKLHSPPPTLMNPETQSKIPTLKRTFYFGMENPKQKVPSSLVHISQQVASLCEDKLNNDIISKKPLAIITPPTSSSSKEQDSVYSLNHKCNSEINDNGIQVNVRPSLPRRQLEIPRFSPIAAWKTLSEENGKQAIDSNFIKTSSSNLVVKTTNAFCIEDRIHRNYREPCPFYPDNKSGDSGISGDDPYIPEKPIQPRNLVQAQNESDEFGNIVHYATDMQQPQPIKEVGPFLTPWTPQQDLEEEESSSDGGEFAIKFSGSQSQAAGHVFSLSLPRENQHSSYSDKTKPDFRSLQKLKRSTSGELNESSNYEFTQSLDSNIRADVCLSNYRTDNWVLSKTFNSANNYEPSPMACDQIDFNNKSSYFDLSVSLQSMTFGCLAAGKHVMYLPNKTTNEEKQQSTVTTPKNSTNSLKKRIYLEDIFSKNIKTKNKRFSFQSSVRQIERRRLAEKLSKEADQKEALRKGELEAMRRVEEEFQRKRAYEKASIRHQLRLYSMDDDNFTSLPVDFSKHQNRLRADPDGAVSSRSESPILRSNEKKIIDHIEHRRRLKVGSDLAMVFANS